MYSLPSHHHAARYEAPPHEINTAGHTASTSNAGPAEKKAPTNSVPLGVV